MTIKSKIHPLLEKKIGGIGSWEQWLKRWEGSNTAEELISLLHYGFERGDVYAIASFYLAVADGHSDIYGKGIGTRSDDTKGRGFFDGIKTSIVHNHSLEHSSVELRQLIAQKAWSVLCVKFFHGWVWNQGSQAAPGWFHYWGERKGEVEFLARLFAFLDPKDGNNNLRTYNDHQKSILFNFMQNLIETAWRGKTTHWTDHSPSRDRQKEEVTKPKRCLEIRTLCYNSRPRLLNMICALEFQEMLLNLPFDIRALTHMEAVFTENTRRAVGKIKEYAACGNKDAQIILLLKNKQEAGS